MREIDTTYQQLLESVKDKGAAFIVLIDPDKQPSGVLKPLISYCEDAGVDALFLGGSLMQSGEFDSYAGALKAMTDLPLIGFPGSVSQMSARLDAILFLSLVSGRNPEFLIAQHVQAAPRLHALDIEAIATAYMLVESGALTTAQYMSGSMPLPRSKPEIAVATALAAEYLGMKLHYLDGGSGAKEMVPLEMVAAVSETCSRPLMVGGGLRTPRDVSDRVNAGAKLVVIGTAIEDRPDRAYIADLAQAARSEVPKAPSG